MKIKIRSIQQMMDDRRTRNRSWTLWFAWRPVRLNSKSVVWLEKVYRRTDYYGSKFDYRSPEDFQP